jgi:hypothetical protein
MLRPTGRTDIAATGYPRVDVRFVPARDEPILDD